MNNSSSFTCKCGKSSGWITEGEELLERCPFCGRKYKGVYNKNTLEIDAVEISSKKSIFRKWVYAAPKE